MPRGRGFKLDNLISKYVNRDIGKLAEDARFYGGVIGASLIVQQVSARYLPETYSKWAGLLTSATGGIPSMMAYVMVGFPSLIENVRGRVS